MTPSDPSKLPSKPVVIVQAPHPVREFREDGPGWKLAALTVVTIERIAKPAMWIVALVVAYKLNVWLR